MISERQVRKLASDASYKRGVQLYESDNLLDFNIQELPGIDSIYAEVKGSGRNYYNVTFVYHHDTQKLGSFDCDCIAFYEYEGICKHCVAAVLEYKDCLEEEEMGYKESPYGVPDQVVPKKITNPSIKALIKKQITDRTTPLIEEEVQGKVRLQPILQETYMGLQVEFKIGLAQMYVVKNVFEFVDALENRSHINYGKKLQFTHSLQAFEEESQAVVSFVQHWVQANKKYYLTTNYYGYNVSKVREIPLDGPALVDFLDAIGETTIYANMREMKEEYWKVTKDTLPRTMRIEGLEDGIQVSINRINGYHANTELVYFNQGKIYRVPADEVAEIQGFISCMAGIESRSVFIQKEDIPGFCRELLPVLEQHYNCEKVNFDEETYGVIPVAVELYFDAHGRNLITCKATANYGERAYNLCKQDQDTNMRDAVSEVTILQLLTTYCKEYSDAEEVMYLEDNDELLYSLLVEGIPKMKNVAEVYVSDAFKRLKVTSNPKVSVGVSVNGERLEINMGSEDMSRDELLEILSKYKRKQKFYRLKNGEFIHVKGEEMEALLELKEGLHLTDQQLKQKVITIPKYRALYVDSQLKQWSSLKTTKNKEYKSLIRNMKTVEDNDFELPESLEDTLREYQKRGFLWIKTLKNNGFGGILADDMGLGKTLQVITFLLSEYKEKASNQETKTLIVCPASLVYNWSQEIQKFAPELSVCTITGSASERKQAIEQLNGNQIAVTSYDLLRRDIIHYEEVAFDYQIIDEAQYIKNSSTQAAKAVKLIQASFKLALTGTPIENRLSELWSIFDYLMPGFLYSYAKFREEIELPIVSNGDEVATKRMQKLIQPFVLRRLKKDVLTDLPDKIEENRYVDLAGEQLKLYNANAKKLKMILSKQSDEEFNSSKIQVLSELTKLRQICCEPRLLYEDYDGESAKLELCMELIQSAVESGHKILLFSQFTSMFELIEGRLAKEKISHFTLTGGTSKEKRAKLVEQFNHDETSVFCISLKAGGTGLNLTAADVVIHYDPWWNYAVQSQATDRAHRIGQENVVNVYRLIVKNTIEENITKIQELKKQLSDQILSGEGMASGSFTRDELLELLN